MTQYAFIKQGQLWTSVKDRAYNAKGDGVTDDRVAIQTALDDAHAAGGGAVYIPRGTYMLSLVTHPNGTNGFGHTALVVYSNTFLFGAGEDLTELKLLNGTLTAGFGVQNRVITNWDMTTGADTKITVANMTVNGNAANNGAATDTCHGVQMWQAKDVKYLDMRSKNNRGNDTATYETFAFDVVRCDGFVYRGLTATADDGGNSATGISMNFSNNGRVTNCRGHNMGWGHGFTEFGCSNVTYDACIATSNGFLGSVGQGFNWECSWNTTYNGCIAGGFTAYQTSATAPTSYTANGSSFGNHDTGFHFNSVNGGFGVVMNGCISVGNGSRGVSNQGSATYTTSGSGTTGSTIVLTTSSFLQSHIGQWVNVNGGAWVQITAVTGSGAASTTCTTSAAHLGSTGQTVLRRAGDITITGGSITGNPNGFQPLDGTTALKQLTVLGTRITTGVLKNNTNDLVNVGNGSTSTGRASGQFASTLTDNLVSATEFFNPFPMDVQVTVNTGTAVSVRGGHPLCTSQSTGAASGTFDIEAGGAITATFTGSVKWSPR